MKLRLVLFLIVFPVLLVTYGAINSQNQPIAPLDESTSSEPALRLTSTEFTALPTPSLSPTATSSAGSSYKVVSNANHAAVALQGATLTPTPTGTWYQHLIIDFDGRADAPYSFPGAPNPHIVSGYSGQGYSFGSIFLAAPELLYYINGNYRAFQVQIDPAWIIRGFTMRNRAVGIAGADNLGSDGGFCISNAPLTIWCPAYYNMQLGPSLQEGV
jgi:hypothetical protein